MEQWSPKQEPTRQEQFILKRLEKKRKLYLFDLRHASAIQNPKAIQRKVA
jgi:hypothetical protein